MTEKINKSRELANEKKRLSSWLGIWGFWWKGLPLEKLIEVLKPEAETA